MLLGYALLLQASLAPQELAAACVAAAAGLALLASAGRRGARFRWTWLAPYADVPLKFAADAGRLVALALRTPWRRLPPGRWTEVALSPRRDRPRLLRALTTLAETVAPGRAAVGVREGGERLSAHELPPTGSA